MHTQLKCLLVLQLLLLSSLLYAQDIEKQLEALGLVEIRDIDPTIQVDLMYASEDNFVGINMYGNLTKAYLLPHIAYKLKLAQKELKNDWGEEFSLLIRDAARPLSVQRKMYEAVVGTPNSRYVASPNNGGGRHNYGAAVDITIVYLPSMTVVDMGSPVDYFGIESHTDNEQDLLDKGLISQKNYENRCYLNRLMNKQGLHNIRREWWHFQEKMSIQEVRKRYQLIP